MCSIPRTILDASFFELFANIFLWTVCQYHLRPLGGQLYPPTGRDLTENGPKILDNFPDLHSPTYFLAFSYLCNIFSHFPAKYFLIFFEFKGRRPQILKKHSATFLMIFTYLQILYSRLYFCSRSYESLRISYQSPLEWEVCNGDDCLKPGICLLHLQANVMQRHLSEWIQGHDFIKLNGWHLGIRAA